jgi:Adenine-specific DNA methylase
MGSKFRLAAPLAEIFESLPDGPAVDAFSGSGVVSYLLKAAGRTVLSNDQLRFATRLAEALVANDHELLSEDEVNVICSENIDGRSFIRDTFTGLYFSDEDHSFLDAAWSHIDLMKEPKQSLALGALCLAAAQKQPRGVFTITSPRYDDGRRQFRMSLEELFREAVVAFNRAVFEGNGVSEAKTGDIFDIEGSDFEVAYLDPPYAPPRDDTCYIKRYHFLEGLATYWRGQEIMWETKTRKIAKKFTPFAYKRLALTALDDSFAQFPGASLVVSYGSNAAIGSQEIVELLRKHRRSIERIEISHKYAFGTHKTAERRSATEFIFVAT